MHQFLSGFLNERQCQIEEGIASCKFLARGQNCEPIRRLVLKDRERTSNVKAGAGQACKAIKTIPDKRYSAIGL